MYADVKHYTWYMVGSMKFIYYFIYIEYRFLDVIEYLSRYKYYVKKKSKDKLLLEKSIRAYTIYQCVGIYIFRNYSFE